MKADRLGFTAVESEGDCSVCGKRYVVVAGDMIDGDTFSDDALADRINEANNP